MGAPENPGDGFDTHVPPRDDRLVTILVVTLLVACMSAVLAAPIAAVIVRTWERLA